MSLNSTLINMVKTMEMEASQGRREAHKASWFTFIIAISLEFLSLRDPRQAQQKALRRPTLRSVFGTSTQTDAESTSHRF